MALEQITQSKARELLTACDMIFAGSTGAYFDYFSGMYSGVRAYLTHGCIAAVTDIFEQEDWMIYPLSESADLPSAIKAVAEVTVPGAINFNTYRRMPEKYAAYDAGYVFVRRYAPYHDDDVRTLTEADADAVRELCTPDLDDTEFRSIGQELAHNILCSYDDPQNYKLLGLFTDGKLAGALAYTYTFDDAGNDMHGIVISELFVKREYRRRGYAERLVRSLCAVREDVVYVYPCISYNTATIKNAQKCGFEFLSAGLYIMPDDIN